MLPLLARVDLGAVTMKGYSPKLQHYWNLANRLFSVISGRSLGVGSYPSAEMQSVYSTVQPTGPQHTRLGSLTLLQRCSRCILQPQSTGQEWWLDIVNFIFTSVNSSSLNNTSLLCIKLIQIAKFHEYLHQMYTSQCRSLCVLMSVLVA